MLDIPLMLVSFMLSQVLIFSLLNMMYQAISTSGPLSTLCVHLAAVVMWTAQFVWCGWMLNCPVLSMGDTGGRVGINKKD